MAIATSQVKPFATVELSWLSTAQGGRKRAVSTVDYAATAYFAEGDKQLFSIILHFHTKVESGVKIITRIDRAVMNFLAPEIAAPQLMKGVEFYVTEGARVVAKGKVLSVCRSLANTISNSSKFSRRSKTSPRKRRVKVEPLLTENGSSRRIVRAVPKKVDRNTAFEYEEIPI
ncbi:hypothetical protein V2H45_08990 [Tumidithrix elongata RA019]|uniref:Uncharacterized protein n=1 Tax=Tumidithrix elongata BACA0141 TaxID=2716417 RepID=A0AAW9Q231_9CYAN|nr:hypothetical protein [Tumidithrix elongata RA019]